MTFDEVITHYGSIAVAAQEIGVKDKAVYKWRDKGQIPYFRQCWLELATKGVLRADTNHDSAPSSNTEALS